ncbi:hypothetical protein N0V83_002124 [Neocucurbitaria cava]|uniref:Uncharacterized protein n=1 Tax=Neocucurbitaria cava TaxID=798079 RepID=A0A9W8YGE9_9PLEO|nr:hypothetical protein N0V83_002124 [Neocucurbitaria cava]
MALENCSQATQLEWTLLDKSLSQFTRLQNLSWDNYANLPHLVLNSVHFYHPFTTVQLKVIQIYAGQATDNSVHAPTFFDSPILMHLTSFKLSVSSNAFLYDNLKRDLLKLLLNAPNLVHFSVYRGPIENDGSKIFPELLLQLRQPRLPQLREFYLSTRSVIFTVRELDVWALEDGWSKLQYLTISRATDLRPFIWRVPQLIYLDVIAENGLGMDEVTRHLNSPSSMGQAFGALNTLVYTHFMMAYYFTHARIEHTMPWAILNNTSTTLTKYVSWHQPYEVFYPGYRTTTFQDLTRFLANYPRVTDLTLDICLLPNRGAPDVVAILARFDNVMRLSLYVHQFPQPQYGIRGLNTIDKELGNAVQLFARTQQVRYGQHGLQADFTQMRNFKVMELYLNLPDWIYWSNRRGYAKLATRPPIRRREPQAPSRRRWANATTEDLQGFLRYWRDMGASTDSIVEEVIAEMARRQRHASLTLVYGDDSVTLYDHWTTEEDLRRRARNGFNGF